MGLRLNSFIASTVLVVVLTLRRRRNSAVAVRRNQCSPTKKHWSLDFLFSMDFTIGIHMDLASINPYFARHGPTFQLESLFGSDTIVTIAPENLQAIYSTGKDFGIQPIRLPMMEYFCGVGFLTTDGSMWQHSRKLLKPSFSKSNISDLSFLSREVDKLFAKLPDNGSTVDLQPLMFIMFLNSSLNFLLGIGPSEKSPNAPCTSEQFVEAFQTALMGTGMRVMLGRWQGLAPKAKFQEACRRSHEYLEHYIQQAKHENEHNNEHGSTLDGQRHRSMIQGLTEQTDNIKYIRSQILQGMMASQETTAVLISNAMFLLARHPREWNKLRTEITRKEKTLLDFDSLSTSKVLQNILSESLRLYPVFAFMGRVCLRDTTLPVGGGPSQNEPIFVPKGTSILTSFFTLHRNEAVFGADALEFVPDRWNTISPKLYEYMAFGAGQRACLGKEKVLAEAAFVLARLAQRFEKLETRDENPWKGQLMLTAKNSNGCKLALFKGRI